MKIYHKVDFLEFRPSPILVGKFASATLFTLKALKNVAVAG